MCVCVCVCLRVSVCARCVWADVRPGCVFLQWQRWEGENRKLLSWRQMDCHAVDTHAHTHTRSRTNSHTLRVTHNSTANKRTYQSTTAENRKTHQHASLNRHRGHRWRTFEIKRTKYANSINWLNNKSPELAAAIVYLCSQELLQGTEPRLIGSLQVSSQKKKERIPMNAVRCSLTNIHDTLELITGVNPASFRYVVTTFSHPTWELWRI